MRDKERSWKLGKGVEYRGMRDKERSWKMGVEEAQNCIQFMHKSRNKGRTSADRSTKATLMLTVPRF